MRLAGQCGGDGPEDHLREGGGVRESVETPGKEMREDGERVSVDGKCKMSG